MFLEQSQINLSFSPPQIEKFSHEEILLSRLRIRLTHSRVFIQEERTMWRFAQRFARCFALLIPRATYFFIFSIIFLHISHLFHIFHIFPHISSYSFIFAQGSSYSSIFHDIFCIFLHTSHIFFIFSTNFYILLTHFFIFSTYFLTKSHRWRGGEGVYSWISNSGQGPQKFSHANLWVKRIK